MFSLVQKDVELVGLSVEKKPEGFPNGTRMLLMDTQEELVFAEAVKTWFTIKAGTKEFQQLSIDTAPTKIEYFEGEKLDLTGLVVVAQYVDSSETTSELDVTAMCKFSIEEGTVLKTTDTKVVITIGENTVEQNITVNAIELESIAVTNPPDKTEYVAGELLDMTGLEVTATYNNDDTKVVTEECTFSPTLETELTTDMTSVTITYGAKTTTQEITVTEEE